MKSFIRGLAIVILIHCISCESDPVIYTNNTPAPVIYGILNQFDSIHYLKIGKTFGAEKDPGVSASIYDSLYFENLEVTATRINSYGEPVGTPYTVQMTDKIPKDPGLFHSPEQQLFFFEANLRGNILVEVHVPGLPTASGKVRMVTIPIINTPKDAQEYLYLVPSSPLLIQWSGHPWNEIDVIFEFVEELNDHVFRSNKVHIQNTNYFESEHEKYREMKITYDEFIGEVLNQIQANDSVKRTYFGVISININGGDENMVEYIKYLHGYNDFNTREYSNIENGEGLLASRISYTWDSLRFDRDTRQTLINDNRLKILKISPWN